MSAIQQCSDRRFVNRPWEPMVLWLALVLCSVWLQGCTSKPERDSELENQSRSDVNPAEPIDLDVSPSGQNSAVRASLPTMSSPSRNSFPNDSSKQELPSVYLQRFDVLADRTPARVFFNSLVHASEVNLLVHEDVMGEISLSLKSVNLLEALEAVRDVYGFDFQLTDYGIRVLPRTQQTRIYPINYLNVNRIGRSGMEVSSGKMTATGSSQPSGTSSGQTGDGGRSSEVETETATDFWQQLRSTLELMVGSEEDSRVVVDVHAGMVIVKATPEVQASVAEYLTRAELSIQRQVLIEAKILEVTLNEGFQSGINWSTIAAQSKKNSVYGDLTSQALTDTSQIGGIFSFNFDIGDLAGALQLLETQGDVKVLSSPRIATVNNQKAVIKVGADEFFVTEVSTTTSATTTSSTESPEIELTPFFSGIALDVTPQIGSNDEVILHVHPKVTEVEERVKIVELSDDEFTLPLAYSQVRETDSIIRARSGQVVVIGGLMQNRQVSTEARVPLLGDIPLLGWFFRQQRQESVQSELVILIQPRVIGSSSPEQEVERILNRFQPELSALQQ